jgi:hypothetical protein
MADVTLDGQVTKIDRKQQLVFGWASVAEVAGKSLVDRQGDVLSEDEMEKMAYRYVSGIREMGVMHKDVGGLGELVESMVFTREKQKAMGIDLGKSAWWIGFRVTNPAVWKRVESGELKAFSIHGKGVREKID